MPKIYFSIVLLLISSLLTAQKIGDNFFISGSDGNGGTSNRVAFSSIAYNSIEDEYLVVWAGEYSNVSDLDPAEPEIWGQLVDASTDTLIGANFRISDLGDNNNPTIGVNAPKAVYNSTRNEYLVVFYGDNNVPPVVNGEAEIYGQRLDADGNEIGMNDFRISFLGDENETDPVIRKKIDANFPDVVYNATNDEYMVVWHGDAPDNDFDVWGQRLRGIDGMAIDTNYQISYINDSIPPQNGQFPVNIKPSICWNSQLNEYLVTWHGGTFFSNTANEYQVYGQLLDSTGFLIDTSFQISNSIEDLARGAYTTYNDDRNEYLVIWVDEANNTQFLVKGHLLDSAGVKIDTTISISNNGEDQFRGLDTQSAEARYDSIGQEYVVIWSANVDTSNDPENTDYQVHFIALDDSTGQTIDTAFVISDLGGDIDNNPSPALSFRSVDRSYFAVWNSSLPTTGDDIIPEIRGQRFQTLNNQCNDGILNGDEEEIDCGGSVCVACPTCDDGIQNGDEEGIDCGGSCPEVCPTCDDGIQNGNETDVDCGGVDCPACPTCDDSIQNGDEEGIDCGGSCPDTCVPTCDDGIQNGDEEDVDCGGTDCPACPTCDDGIQNGEEIGVDCGGSCPNMCCTVGETCDDGDINTINDTLNMECVCVGVPIARLDAKIFLEGAYQNTNMLDSLRAKGKIPVQSPYSDALMVSDSATVFAEQGDLSVVDWVEIELRTTSNGVSVAKRSALVRRDGRVVDESGNIPIRFPNLEAGDYYVIIRHRNHVAVMTEEKVRLE
ncbi:MAG: hypothetical protein AAGG68_12925 [Bacteroidota bacterium]